MIVIVADQTLTSVTFHDVIPSLILATAIPFRTLTSAKEFFFPVSESERMHPPGPTANPSGICSVPISESNHPP